MSHRRCLREKLWTIQRPQAFSYPLIKDAYDKMIRMEEDGCLDVKITDDAMVAGVYQQNTSPVD